MVPVGERELLMKLIYCGDCGDVVALRRVSRACECGKSSGYYREDGYHAIIKGEKVVPIGFVNRSFYRARLNQPYSGDKGEEFTAFVIPVECATITHKGKEMWKYFRWKRVAQSRRGSAVFVWALCCIKPDCGAEARVRGVGHVKCSHCGREERRKRK